MRLTVVVSSLLAGVALLFGSGEATAQKASPPDVVGMKLPEAEGLLKADGWKPRPFNTDTLFGIIVKSHYAV